MSFLFFQTPKKKQLQLQLLRLWQYSIGQEIKTIDANSAGDLIAVYGYSVRKINSSGGNVWVYSLPSSDVMYDAKFAVNNIVFCMTRDGYKLLKLNTGGTYSTSFTGFTAPNYVSVNIARTYAFFGSANGILYKVDTYLTPYIQKSISQASNCLAESPSGNIFIGTQVSTIIKATPAGAIASTFNMSSNVLSIVIDANNNLYVADSNKNVIKLDSNGNVIWQYAFSNNLKNLDIDSNGNIYIPQVSGILTKMSADKQIIWEANTNDTISCIKLDGLGNILIGDGSYRVCKYLLP